MSNYTTAWDETLPPGSESKSLGDNRIRELKNQIRERLATEHSAITEEVGDAKLLHLPGKTSVLYYGTTTQINALTGMSEGALAFDTTIGALKIYTSSAWTVLPFDWDGMWGGGDAVHTHTSDAEGGLLSSILAPYTLKADFKFGFAYSTNAQDTTSTTYVDALTKDITTTVTSTILAFGVVGNIGGEIAVGRIKLIIDGTDCMENEHQTNYRGSSTLIGKKSTVSAGITTTKIQHKAINIGSYLDWRALLVVAIPE